jgi:hypothetical protein
MGQSSLKGFIEILPSNHPSHIKEIVNRFVYQRFGDFFFAKIMQF